MMMLFNYALQSYVVKINSDDAQWARPQLYKPLFHHSFYNRKSHHPQKYLKANDWLLGTWIPGSHLKRLITSGKRRKTQNGSRTSLLEPEWAVWRKNRVKKSHDTVPLKTLQFKLKNKKRIYYLANLWILYRTNEK